MQPRLDRRDVIFGAALAAFAPAIGRAASEPAAIAQDVAALGAPDPALEAKITALANEAGLARIGFAAVDLVKGRTAFVRGGELFAMQSVYKFPIAVAYLRMVQNGEARLDTKVRLSGTDIAPGHSPLRERLLSHPTAFTAQQLIEHMLLNSDNTAVDALMKLAGGPAKIQATIKSFAIDGLRIDRYEREIQPQSVGLDPSPTLSDPAAFEKAIGALDAAKQKDAMDRYLRDPRDTASPRAIATLFTKVTSSHLIQPRFAMLLLDIMRRTKTGDDRLKGGLLPGWTFAHRSGTSGTLQGVTAVFNDAGLAQHKGGAKIAIVLFIEGATLSADQLAQFHRATARAVIESWN